MHLVGREHACAVALVEGTLSEVRSALDFAAVTAVQAWAVGFGSRRYY